MQELEKHPLQVVPAEPSELLDRDRYQRSSRDLVSSTHTCWPVTLSSATAVLAASMHRIMMMLSADQQHLAGASSSTAAQSQRQHQCHTAFCIAVIVLCAVCCVLCAVCCVLCAVCCVLCAVACHAMLCCAVLCRAQRRRHGWLR
jgi:hypothetical protein